jgi:hypothetical protein
MKTVSRIRVLRAFTGMLVMAAGGCFFPDTDALQAKILEECRVVPLAPACVDTTDLDDPASRRAWDRFLDDVDSEREQACILDLDCIAIGACLDLDDAEPSLFPWDAPAQDDDELTLAEQGCLIDCSGAYFDGAGPCGDEGATCSAEVVDTCADDLSACNAACLQE